MPTRSPPNDVRVNRTSAQRAIVLAPHGRDAAIAAAMLREAGIDTVPAVDLPALVEALRAGAGFALVTEEALRGADLYPLDAFLKEQEEWSDFPFILLTQRGGGLERNPAAVRLLETLGNVTFLERPFHPTTLISLAKSAVRARLRQYEARSRLAAINASEAQFRAFAQAMANHVWTAPPDGKLDWFNQRTLEYSGLTQAALVGDRWAAIVHADDLPDAAALWASSVASGTDYETEFRIRRADGEYRWHLVRALPIRADDGAILRWIGTNTDIHEQKLSEVESQRDRDRLWMLSQDLMLVCDFDGVVTAVNPSAMRLLGWREDEMVGHNIVDFLHPDDVATTAMQFATLLAGATTLAFENRYARKQGGYRLLDWTAVPDAGRVHAVGRDITEERNLARDRERIWNLSPVVKLVLSISGEVHAVNPSWTKVLGWSAEETIGRKITDFVAPDELPRSLAALAELAGGAPLLEVERIYMNKDGSRRRLAWITVADGGTLYSFGRDVTAEREAADALAETEAALRQSQKMEAVGQLTGGIAHDFNNLLQGITGSLEIVQRRLDAGRLDGVDRFLDGAANAANRAAALTHRLLAFSRRQPLDPRPVDANPLIASMEDLMRRTLGEQIDLDLVLVDDLWLTLCDHNQLENAILNLVINARDAMPDGGRLTIETSNADFDRTSASRHRDQEPGEYVCIRVTDTGSGMDADTIARAFEPFFTTKPLGQGTGLGLSMIYGFARQSEGHATIESEPGVGTSVSLCLPRHVGAIAVDDPAPASADRTAPAGTEEVVLVVEDEPVVRGLIVEVLTELGYRAIEASDGPEGLEKLRARGRIDLLVTDIGLPGLNGRQIADAGREFRPDLKVLYMTGYAENAALAPGFLQPGTAIITKPFAIEALAARVRSMLEAPIEQGMETVFDPAS
jgi:PAS domain S-box-containing protein